MDVIFGLLFIWFIFWAIGAVFRAMGAGTRAAINAAQGKGGFKENLEVQYKGMGPLEMKLKSANISDENLPVWEVKLRGLFHVGSATDLTVVTSLLDLTEKGKPKSVLAGLENFQEPDTTAFRFNCSLGVCEPGQGFLHWINVATIPKDLLRYPHSGRRKITICVRVVNQNNFPKIKWGFAAKQPGIVQQFFASEFVQVDRGFLERSQEELGVAAASLRLGLALGFSDGSFDPSEGKLIKGWAAKFVNEVPEGTGRESARTYVNDAIRFGAEDARGENLSISSQIDVLNKLADKPEKYAAVELCLDIMAADGTADKHEIKLLNRLCESLDLDSDRFNELRDRRLLSVDSHHMEGSNIWESLSISSSIPDQQKRVELRKMFRKWNAAAESLEDTREREKAHQMLELIAEARSLLDA